MNLIDNYKQNRGDMRLAHIFFILLMCLAGSVDAKPLKKAKAVGAQPMYSAIVIDAHTGKILHNEQADSITYPASLTKMMTLYLLFEAIETGKLDPNKKLIVSKYASTQSPTKLYLKAGDTISVRDALLGIMTKSANDASVVVAEGLAGSEEQFAARMTAKARALGMANTTFCNASGLPNLNQKTTARDMATLSLAIYKHYPRYYSFFRTKSFYFKGQSHQNHNHLLGKVPGLDGIKTGWIIASGWNLSASAMRDGQRVMAVVMGGKSRLWRDKRVADLIEAGFEKLNNKNGPLIPVPSTRPEMNVQAQAEAAREAPQSAAPVASAHTALAGTQSTPPQSATPPSIKTALAATQATPPQPRTKPKIVSVSEKQSVMGKWGVQVGAFSSIKRAEEVAAQVQEQVGMLSNAKVVISPIKHTRGKIYQTRLVNLPESIARKACTQVVKNGHSCMALKIVK
jgi:D-alanyl-D-alanine carboxypeptidase